MGSMRPFNVLVFWACASTAAVALSPPTSLCVQTTWLDTPKYLADDCDGPPAFVMNWTATGRGVCTACGSLWSPSSSPPFCRGGPGDLWHWEA